jgi:hypothetical protein
MDMRQRLKGMATAVGVPIRFSMTTGHYRAALSRRSVDAGGHPIPWYTYPALDFLSSISFASDDVLEFGGGYSTIWWSQHARSVVTVEGNPDWFEEIKPMVNSNVSLHLYTELTEHAAAPREMDRSWPVIIIDGGNRLWCAETALAVATDDPLIVLDNSEGSWGQPGSFPIIDLMEANGFARIDFSGYAAGTFQPSCTSLFFRSPDRFRRLPPPHRPRR